jgi:hypothetical protein
MLDGCRIMPGKVKGGLTDQSNVPVAPITARRINSAPRQCDGVLDAGQCTCQTRGHHEERGNWEAKL